MASEFTVVALIAARNENDIIGQVIEDLVEQGVLVYFIDDGSTDGTVETVERWRGRGVLGLEHRPASATFDWAAILRRKAALATELDASWFIHQDADEFRQSPFPGKSLRDAIREVDTLGYNAIDFRVLNFRPTTADSGQPAVDVRESLRYYEPAEYWETPQIKAWKKTPGLELAASGGHEAAFDGRLVCPIQFLVRHYPVRTQAQGEQKVFADRQPRFLPAEREAGWHVQYDSMSRGQSFLREPSSLTRFDEAAVLRDLRLIHRDTPGLAATSARLAAVEQDLKRRTTELNERALELEDRLANKSSELAAVSSEFRRAQATLEEVQRQLTSQQAEAGRERTSFEARARALREQTAALGRHAANLEDLLLASGRSAADAAEHHASAIRGLQQELSAVYASKSWRMTMPARWALGILQGAPDQTRARVIADTRDPINWGDLATVAPLSNVWGVDRGRPIDRYFIEAFLRQSAADIRGVVFEIKDPGYTNTFGRDRVTDSIVVDVNPENPLATLHADMTKSDEFPSAAADCFILTQTIHIIYDYASALRTALQVLKPGGVLLCTIPAVSRVNYENGGLTSGDFWRMTRAAVERLFEDLEYAGQFEIQTFGNVRTCAAFLYGLAVEDMLPAVLDFHDPWFPLIHCVRVIKKA